MLRCVTWTGFHIEVDRAMSWLVSNAILSAQLSNFVWSFDIKEAFKSLKFKQGDEQFIHPYTDGVTLTSTSSWTGSVFDVSPAPSAGTDGSWNQLNKIHQHHRDTAEEYIDSDFQVQRRSVEMIALLADGKWEFVLGTAVEIFEIQLLDQKILLEQWSRKDFHFLNRLMDFGHGLI